MGTKLVKCCHNSDFHRLAGLKITFLFIQNMTKITPHMWRRWSTPQNLCLAFIDEPEKQLFIKKNCWRGPMGWSVRTLIFNFAFLFKKIKKNTWRYHYFTPFYQTVWWYDLLFLRYKLSQIETGNYRSFFALLPPPKNPKNQNFEKMTKLLEISSFYSYVPKTTIIWVVFLEIPEWDRQNFLPFWTIFFPLPPKQPRKSNFWKNENSIGRCHHVTLVHHKSWSYDVSFLRYWVQQTFFVILGHFLPFYPEN